MNILLRKAEGKVWALDPDDGRSLTKINPGIYCENDNLSTEYEHAEGIYWESFAEAKRQIHSINYGFSKKNIKGNYAHHIVRD